MPLHGDRFATGPRIGAEEDFWVSHLALAGKADLLVCAAKFGQPPIGPDHIGLFVGGGNGEIVTNKEPLREGFVGIGGEISYPCIADIQPQLFILKAPAFAAIF